MTEITENPGPGAKAPAAAGPPRGPHKCGMPFVRKSKSTDRRETLVETHALRGPHKCGIPFASVLKNSERKWRIVTAKAKVRMRTMARITAAVAGAILAETPVVIGADLAEVAGATLAATGVDLITAAAAMPVETVADAVDLTTAAAAMPVETVADAVDLITADAETTAETITNGTSADAETTAETVANVGAAEDAPRLKPTTP